MEKAILVLVCLMYWVSVNVNRKQKLLEAWS